MIEIGSHPTESEKNYSNGGASGARDASDATEDGPKPRERRNFRETVDRLSRLAETSAGLLRRVLQNTERLVDDIVGDTSRLVGDVFLVTEAATSSAAQLQIDLGGAAASAPRVVRICKEVGLVVASYRLHKAKYDALDAIPTPAALERLHRQNAKRIYRLCVDLRGALIKVGQLLSARVDFMPQPWIDELSKLQDQVPGVPTDDIIAVIEAELGESLEALFSAFDHEPIAAASLAQVHAARLPDGTEVVVKVQVPGIREMVNADLKAFDLLARALKDILPKIDLRTVAREVRRSVESELDYIIEADNTRAFFARYQDHDFVTVPEVMPGFRSKKVLVQRRLEGRRLIPFLDELEQSPDAQVRIDAFFSALIRLFCDQILTHGFFHADPHPGNFLVLEGDRLGLLDYGAVMTLTPDARRGWAELSVAAMTGDSVKMADCLRRVGFVGRNDNHAELEHFCELFLEHFASDLTGNLADMNAHDQFEKAMAIARDNPIVQIPHDSVLLGRVLGTLGGFVLRYKPQVNLFKIALPYLTEVMTSSDASTSDIAN